MPERDYSSYAEWYTEGPFSAYIRAAGMAGDMISVVEATQPDGDLSDPPINDLVLIRMLSTDVPCAIDLGAGRFSVSQNYGDYILISPNTRSDIQMYASHTVELFSLPAANCKELLSGERTAGLDFGKLHRKPFRSDLLDALCQRLVTMARTPERASRLFVDGASAVLLAELTRLAGEDRDCGSRVHADDWRIRRTLEQIEAQLGEDISLAMLAAAVDLSPSHYSALFRSATGSSPHAWITRRRIERACEMLAQPHVSVTDVALSLGFSSPQHFAVAFRSHVGATPTGWRRQQLSGRGEI